ncbi:variable large family protein [Borrelia coriaceae]|uniref:variable large family protein n=1 Tax=Borrelia coriaceae TaxID=144 RepID=UPI0004B16741|nr:variable large family protein [Borrelia coriaceae]
MTNVGEVVSGVTAGSASQVAGSGVSVQDVKETVKALKGIVAANTNKAVKPTKDTVSSGDTNGGKVLKTTSSGEATAADASKALAIVNSVTGEDMLYAITSADENSDVVAEATTTNATDPKHAVKLAVTGSATSSDTAENASKVAVAGGIALRSLLKGGKLNVGSQTADSMAVNGSLEVSAANRLLKSIENVIQVIIKQCLEQTQQILGDSKSKSPQEKK